MHDYIFIYICTRFSDVASFTHANVLIQKLGTPGYQRYPIPVLLQVTHQRCQEKWTGEAHPQGEGQGKGE